MKRYKKLIVEVIVVVLGVILVLAIVNPGKQCPRSAKRSAEMSGACPVVATETKTEPVVVPVSKPLEQIPAVGQIKTLPKLIDLGATECIPCKMMAPILDELKMEYKDFFTVEFIDVWKNPDIGEKFGVNTIPIQIFFDENGKELFRHEGFISKEDILVKWQELGVKISNEAEKK